MAFASVAIIVVVGAGRSQGLGVEGDLGRVV